MKSSQQNRDLGAEYLLCLCEALNLNLILGTTQSPEQKQKDPFNLGVAPNNYWCGLTREPVLHSSLVPQFISEVLVMNFHSLPSQPPPATRIPKFPIHVLLSEILSCTSLRYYLTQLSQRNKAKAQTKQRNVSPPRATRLVESKEATTRILDISAHGDDFGTPQLCVCLPGLQQTGSKAKFKQEYLRVRMGKVPLSK